eukprot:9280455-Pyramimonas_sp.AAC.1
MDERATARQLGEHAHRGTARRCTMRSTLRCGRRTAHANAQLGKRPSTLELNIPKVVQESVAQKP